MPRDLAVVRLGQVEYEDGLALQKLYGQARLQQRIPDTLLLLEHPPVLTLGRSAKRENITANDIALAAMGVEIHETNRGGDVTYHGPGQIVGYPIFHLAPDRQDVRRYVRNVEESVIRTLARYQLHAKRIPKWPGVWLGEEGVDARKIGAIGVHLSRWLTSHGFALNVNTTLAHFDLIVPCGIKEAGVTTMERELDRELPLSEVETAVAESFAEVFEARLLPEAALPGLRTISAAVLRPSTSGWEALMLQRTPARGGFWQPVTGKIEPGEAPVAAAAREVEEETGQRLEVEPLAYRHSFAQASDAAPKVIEETGFLARWPRGDAPVRLQPSEHVAHAWLPLADAIALAPFKGLKETLKRAAVQADAPRR